MFLDALKGLLDDVAGRSGIGREELAALIEYPPARSMGDLALPCFRLAKTPAYAGGKPPPQIATELAAQLAPAAPIVRIEARGPYLNFFLNAAYKAKKVLQSILDVRWTGWGRRERSTAEDAPPVVIEYSSPNIAKPFGVGHLRSTIIGNALALMFEATGKRVIRLNYPGDWGTQFGLLLAQWIEEGNSAPTEFDPVVMSEIVGAYVKANLREQEDAAFAARARGCFRLLEAGDNEMVRLWQAFRERSMEYFEGFYGWLGTRNFDERNGEAFIARNEDGGNWIQEVLDAAGKADAAKKSEGALIIDLEKFGMPPVMLLKSDGTTTYHTRDLAAALYRWNKWQFERMFYVVGSDQTLHFRQISKALELMNVEPAGRIEHVPFGLIRFGGGKMSTRGGNVVPLDDLKMQLEEMVAGIVRQNNPQLPEGDVSLVTGDVALGAVVFEDLGRRRIKDVDFDWERALRLTGDTGPYLQYTYARLCSIERKAAEAGITAEQPDYSLLASDEEDAVVDLLARAGEVLERAVAEREPSIVATYLLDLAGAVNRFYNTHRVLGDDAALTAARLRLVSAVRMLMGGEPPATRDGVGGSEHQAPGGAGMLGLIGISAPPRM